MVHTELDLHDRRRIEDVLNAKISVREIAAEIGHRTSTVYRDIQSLCDRLNDTPESVWDGRHRQKPSEKN
jgi:IS30 family transposase